MRLSVFLIIFNVVAAGFVYGQNTGLSAGQIWETTIETGIYFANPYQAAYYNGKDGNENEINFILKNPYQRLDIANELQVADTFYLHGLPEKMRYNPAVAVGFSAIRHLENNFALDFRASYAKLHAIDFFTLEMDPGSVLGPKRTEFFNIYGSEERINIDIGVRKFLPVNLVTTAFLGGGFNINNTKVIDSKIRIGNLEYSIVNIYLNQNYIPGAPLVEYEIHQGGIGYGGFATAGLRFRFSDAFSIETAATYYNKTINLTNYPQTKSHFMAAMRLCFVLVKQEE